VVVVTLARLVLRGVPLACHLGLLRVSAAHDCSWQVALLRLWRRGSKGCGGIGLIIPACGRGERRKRRGTESRTRAGGYFPERGSGLSV
jgi:hypothetical protein